MKRKYIILILFFVIQLSSGCKKNPEIVSGYFDSVHFIREGGGQIDFTISPADNLNELTVFVSKYNFKDSSIQLKLELTSNLEQAFSYYNQALNNQIQINGDFKQPTTKTGTWVYIYVIDNAKEIEITNTDLRSSFLIFEQKVKDLIK